MHNWDEGVYGVDETPGQHDRKCFPVVKMSAGPLHFSLSNLHFVANGFAIAPARRTIIRKEVVR